MQTPQPNQNVLNDATKQMQSLQKALQYAELLAEAYSKMIDLAEQEYGISIRKK